MLRQGIAALALAWCVGAVRAESVVIAGGSLSGQTRVLYGGVVSPLPGKRLADGWSQSLVLTGARYEYPVDARDVQGIATGLKYGLMRQAKVWGGTLGIGAGVAWQHTSLSPDDPGNPNAGSHLRPLVELQWRSDADRPWRSQVFAQHVFGERSNHAVAFVGRRLRSGVAIGPQVSTSGDPNYRVHGTALAVNGMKLGLAEAGFYLGAQHLEGGRTQPEAGFSFVLYRP